MGTQKAADLQENQDLSIVFLQGYVKSRFLKLAKSMDVGSIFDQQLYNVSMVVLCGPVQSCHLQHVLGIHIGTILSQKRNFFKETLDTVAQVQDAITNTEDFHRLYIFKLRSRLRKSKGKNISQVTLSADRHNASVSGSSKDITGELI